MSVTAAGVCFDHLIRLTDDCGIFEHARFTRPRREHGYCVDDVARGLLVTVREPRPDADLVRLSELYLRFVLRAQTEDGRFRNRRDVHGVLEAEASVADCWGRALWGLGAAVAKAPTLAARALASFDRSASLRSPWSRAMAFAALGAAEVLVVAPEHGAARALLADAATLIGSPPFAGPWIWTEPRLRYANAVLPEVLLAAGSLLGDPSALTAGLAMLGWLVDTETAGEQLSVTPVGGWTLGEPRPGFDQQPIEVAALADACARAYEITGELHWRAAIERCAAWFIGDNDSHTAMIDPASGGGYDGLERSGRNENEGAESTLAMLSTMQQRQRLP